jgi:hypothetical protein
MNLTEEQEIATLSAADLASILKWSKVVSSDINLSSGLCFVIEGAMSLTHVLYSLTAPD